MTGPELAALRRSAGLSQAALAQRAGVGRHAVSYWETKARVNPQALAVRRMAEVLALPVALAAGPDPWVERSRILAQEHHVALMAQVRACQVRVVSGPPKARTTSQPRCGAMTRKGAPCICKPLPGKTRCKFHGGMSTGARTPEGLERIREAQRQRWDRWRRDNAELDEKVLLPGST